jgi:hypothetical protein
MKNNKNISIEEIGKELPFSVPENYFEQFALQIEEQIGARKHRSRFLRSWMYVAATIVAIFVIGTVSYNINQRNMIKNSDNYEAYVMAQVNETAVMDYYVDNTTK